MFNLPFVFILSYNSFFIEIFIGISITISNPSPCYHNIISSLDYCNNFDCYYILPFIGRIGKRGGKEKRREKKERKKKEETKKKTKNDHELKLLFVIITRLA